MQQDIASQSFARDLELIENLAVRPASTPDALARTLEEIYSRAANAEFSHYDVAALRQVAPEVMYRLFDLRTGLRERIPDLRAKGFMTPPVVNALRDVFRVLRYVSDMLGEIAIDNSRVPAGEFSYRGFTGQSTNTLANHKFTGGQPVSFQPGDVILIRGHAHNSAAIARIGDVDSQFSHVGVVHVDGEGRHWMVESLIEDGAIINPLSSSLEHNIARAVLYRFQDAQAAAAASKWIYDYVAPTREKRGKRIPYDFSFKLDDSRPLFCSKLVKLAFERSSGGAIRLPAYPTRIAARNRDFLDRIGLKANETYAPADIDLEPQFDLVAEWQDYRETSNIRLQDFTMDKIFEWMETRGYRFEETASVRIVSLLGRFASHLSDDAKALIEPVFPRVPDNMRRKTIAAVAMLHKTAEPVYRALQAKEQACIAEFGRPMHGREIFAELEDMRRAGDGRLGYLVAGG